MGYVRISDNPLGAPQGTLYQIWAQNMFAFAEFDKNYVIYLGP